MIRVIVSMVIWGSIGIFIRYIDLPSTEIAFLRAVIAAIVLLAFSFISNKINFNRIKDNLVLLIIAGMSMGFNWILLFQSYHYTNIANSTISYYFAPIIVIVLSPIFLKEKLTISKIISVIGANVGLFIIMYYSSNNIEKGINDSIGIVYGLSAALLYAVVVLVTKYMKNITGFEITVVEMIVAGGTLLPFVLQRNQMHIGDVQSLILILILGIVHTGIAYLFYFSGIHQIKIQNAAILSYIDPLSAILFSLLILGEHPTSAQKLGAVLIFGFTLFNEIRMLQKKIT